MSLSFIDLIDPVLAHTFQDAAADEWGRRAADMAKAEAQAVGAASVSRWLDVAEQVDMKRMRTQNRERWGALRSLAAAKAQAHSQLMGNWDG